MNRRLRTVIHGCVFLLLAAGLIQTWLIDGLLVPCRVAGDSMAGALLGVHRNVVCGDCGCTFPCGTDVRPTASRAVCLNCGYAANDLESLPDVDADRVLIDRAAFAIRTPRRWEIAAFRQDDKILVKRIVGLPGESVEIRHGDVYADGCIQRKNLAQQRALAILVHDADFPARQGSSPLPRWRDERSDSRWSVVDGRFTHAAAGDHAPIDWFAYHHPDGPITDLCGYNPSQPRREEDVHAVTDLMLSLRLGPVSGQGAFYIRTTDGGNHFETRLQFDNDGSSVQCAIAGEQGTRRCEIPATGGERLVEVSLVDQQFLLAVDGQPIATWPYDRPEPPPLPTSCPLAIGAEGIGVTVRELRVYRDVYYSHPIGAAGHRPGNRPVGLGEGKYYVLGDNSPVSEDSRTWPEPGACNAKSLVGKPLVAIPSVSPPVEGRWYFQVPNLLQIRYIR